MDDELKRGVEEAMRRFARDTEIAKIRKKIEKAASGDFKQEKSDDRRRDDIFREIFS